MFGNFESRVSGALGPFRDPAFRLSDGEIRRAFSYAAAALCSNAQMQVLEEVRLLRGRVRADYVFSSREQIGIVEIKSDLDSLRRFEEQLRIYSCLADRVLLVVGWNLAPRALRIAPQWWDIWLAERSQTRDTAFIPMRDGVQNPSIDQQSLARMLPVNEARRALTLTGYKLRSNIRTSELYRALADHLNEAQLRVVVAEWLSVLAEQRRGTRTSSREIDRRSFEA